MLSLVVTASPEVELMEHVVILYSAVGDSGTLFYIRISNFFTVSLTHAFCFFFFLIIAILMGFRWYLTIFFFFGYTRSSLPWGLLSSCGAWAFYRGGVWLQNSGSLAP